MKNLGALPSPPFPYFTAIVTAKQSQKRIPLQQQAPFVAARYTVYHQNTANLTPLPVVAVSEQVAIDLIHCYDSPTSALDQLKAEIKTHHTATCGGAAALCQYCGISYSPSTFDHYLPKDIFPEFSVLSLNLVPSCGNCNNLKGKAWLDANGVRRIVSLYYDTLPKRRFLYANIDLQGTIPVADFYLSNDPADYGEIMATIHNHYDRLRLLSRYKTAATATFDDIKIEFGGLVQSKGPAAVAQMLLKKAQDLSQSRSPNYWEVALLSAMANNAPYLNSL